MILVVDSCLEQNNNDFFSWKVSRSYIVDLSRASGCTCSNVISIILNRSSYIP